MSKSRIGAINDEFQTRVKPIFESWGLIRHPNSQASFGREQHGYMYEFADVRDPDDIRLCRFAISIKDSSLDIIGEKGVVVDPKDGSVPVHPGFPAGFALLRPFSFRHFFTRFIDRSFSLEQHNGETVEAAAARLIDDVVKELPRLKRYLYG
ncbi:hypothetical protein [Kumtagia ephedrae]|uniref:Uncharacterized protein n=1 Tax=Kumtagia ephedrae TaxID=2116701 RepID=A0A2P7SHD1_9HYPH|nr:hypothetical protein [Mesorhizobium ephedrae]PSJ61877.1 hypothetical protein C7I84_09795 [Mesorhizobium ephedrae]